SDPMTENTTKSDLIDKVHHEHQHLCRLFEDLQSSFEKINSGELDGESRAETLESASEDLAVALDEMLHHFDQEEEVFFVDIEERFPDLREEIVALVAAHELMGERTRWLQAQLKKPVDVISRDAGQILDVIRGMTELVIKHTEDEQRLFDVVLQKIPADERVSLLKEMQSI
ncbi:MAG: hemerythrin domain-containing protein, partial [Bradymonadaceae bacterium]